MKINKNKINNKIINNKIRTNQNVKKKITNFQKKIINNNLINIKK